VTPFAPDSISLRLYPHDLDAPSALREMIGQAAVASEVGFDGVMVSERHGGIVGNVPNPLQVAGWLAAEMSGGWVAPCPVLALLRPPALVVEEVAWLAARYPDRVGVGLATGGHDLDFSIYGLDRDRLTPRFEEELAFVASHLSGAAADDLAGDPAVARCRDHPVPVLSAAMSPEAARRAARCRVGIIGSSLVPLDRERRLGAIYRQAGGTGPEVLIRFVWIGPLPVAAVHAKFGDYERASVSAGRRLTGAAEIITSDDTGEIAERLAEAMATTGRTCLHLRVHVPGVPPEAVREQLGVLGQQVLPRVRSAMVSARNEGRP